LIDIPCFDPIATGTWDAFYRVAGVWQGGAEGNVTCTLGQALIEEGFAEVNA